MKKVLVFFVFAVTFCVYCQPEQLHNKVGAAAIVKIDAEIPENFHKVSKTIYRSAQPQEEEFRSLYSSHDLRSVLNLRKYHSDKYKIKNVNRKYKTTLQLYEIPLSAGSITEKDLVTLLTVIRDAPKPLLIHCWHGSDRTGCAVAAYRIVFENWQIEDAIRELMTPEYGHHKNIYRNIPELLRKADWKSIKAEITGKK